MLHLRPDVDNDHNLASELTILFLYAPTGNVQIMQCACSHILQIWRLTTKKNFHEKNLYTFISYQTIPEDRLTSEFFMLVCRKSNIAQRRSFRFICGLQHLKLFHFILFHPWLSFNESLRVCRRSSQRKNAIQARIYESTNKKTNCINKFHIVDQ